MAHVNAFRAVKRILRRAKRNKEEQVALDAKRNPKAFYCYINDRRVCRESIGPLVDPGGNMVSDEAGMATLLNNHFASVFTVENTDELPRLDAAQADAADHAGATLDTVQFTPAIVEEKMGELEVHKSVGPDNMHPRVLKELEGCLSASIADIFSRSMATAEVPDEWKIANVTGIYKKGGREIGGNYRPISLTSVVCKTIERIIRDTLVDYLEHHQIIIPTQHGLSQRRSCLTNLLEFFGQIYQEYDECKAVDLIYFDFQKAFDKVPRERLLLKVASLGIRGNLQHWIRSWLSGRRQRVCIGQACSEWVPVTSGVPQGCVLGPVLFLIYVNDIDTGITSRISKFADDTKLCKRVDKPELRLRLQEDINKLAEWSDRWMMPFNTSKCTVKHLECHNRNHQYAMDGNQITSVSLQRDLGILISSDLRWDHQVNESCKKASKVLGMIAWNFTYKTRNIILPLYKTLIRPHLDYGVKFWGTTLRKHAEQMERIHRRVTKLIPELRNTPSEERLRRLSLTPLEQRRLRGQLIETYKYLEGVNRVYSSVLFPVDRHPRVRHNGRKLLGFARRTTVAQQFFPNRIVGTWNALPAHVVSAPSVNAFKARLDRYWETNPP